MFPRPLLAVMILTLLPLRALAHPHVFIDAGLVLDYDEQGALTQVTVEWAYDDFYSLLIIEDLGLDPDGDGILTPAEEAALQDFDAEWQPGFDGRLYLGVEGRRIALRDGQQFGARYQDGRLISHHVRPLEQPLDGDMPLLIQVYDPEYYVQFSIPQPPAVRGADCRTELRLGDPYAAADAYARAVSDALAEGTVSDLEQEMLVVDIGSVGADEVRVTCGAGS